MSGDQQTVSDDMRLPVRQLRVFALVLLEHIFDQERNDLGQSDGFFLGIREAGHRFALHYGFSFGVFGMAQHAGRVTNGSERFPRSQRRFDQGDGGGIFGEIPQRTMAARVKDSIKISGGDICQFKRVGQFGLRGSETVA